MNRFIVGNFMTKLRELILNYDFESIEFNAQDDIIDHKNLPSVYAWLALSETDDHFDEVTQSHQPMTHAVASIEEANIYDHYWLMKKVKCHISDYMEASGLGSKQLSLNILEILTMKHHGMIRYYNIRFAGKAG